MSSETPALPDPQLDNVISQETLAKSNGAPGCNLYVALYVTKYGQVCVFDVSSRADLYGPGCGYNVLTARDASYALATMDLKTTQSDISNLTEDQRKVLNDWAEKYLAKYPLVGVLVSEEK